MLKHNIRQGNTSEPWVTVVLNVDLSPLYRNLNTKSIVSENIKENIGFLKGNIE